MAAPRWQFFVDRGGTFTDCIGRDPDTGELRVVKVPSTDDAPLIGMRRLLGLAPEAPLPPCELRLGTTLGTNALLERRGSRSALLVTRGFADLLALGDQTRPDLFALKIERAAPLPERVVELTARLTADGEVLERPDPVELAERLGQLRRDGVESVGVAILNDYGTGVLEPEIARIAREAGFEHVACGHELVPSIGYLSRASTVAIDSYLTPLLARYLHELQRNLPFSRLLLMQSSGGLCDAARFRGTSSVLSGPAGGAVALAAIALAAGVPRAVGLDMGGTSTDVSRVEAGHVPRVREAIVAGARISAPMVAVHTVAAGGGSVCRYDGDRLQVGPESVGADPGPLCYGSAGATDLALSDVNLVLGRLVPDRFPLPLHAGPPLAKLELIAEQLRRAGHAYGPYDVAEGFFRVAGANMAQAIREVTVARGFDLREHALVVFGGAGGQHACALARELGAAEILFHPHAGVLSALGIGLADLSWDGSAEAGGVSLSDAALAALQPTISRLRATGRRALERDGAAPDSVLENESVGLRYAGTETSLEIPRGSAADMSAEFGERFRTMFGYTHEGRALELTHVSVSLRSPSALPPLPPSSDSKTSPPVSRRTRWYYERHWLEDVPVYEREVLTGGSELSGPAIIVEATGTIALEPGFLLRAGAGGMLRVTLAAQPERAAEVRVAEAPRPDPVLLEIYASRFMSIAEQMGRTLRLTSMSVNIRERLDFSCAVFDRAGELTANAPHIPVHLGAMSESVKAVVRAHPALAPGDVFVTNDPAGGGSHLPDITVVAPVHDAGGTLRFFAAARGHHADVGGTTPGSMPAFSTRLAEEGVVLRAIKAGRAGELDHALLRGMFEAGPLPARRVRENLADLEAQLAAVRTGARLLLELADVRGITEVERYMGFVQENASHEVQRALRSLPPGRRTFRDALDDGTPVVVTLELEHGELRVDFSGTGGEHAGNLNAPRAVTLASVLYFLRLLVAKPIPLNSGCLRHVRVLIPTRSLLDPGPECAVAGGNVETSQRIVDVLLGAAGLLAGSQGTMNNLSFGNQHYGYYETIAGGAGAGRDFDGASGVHTHMTNTRITDAEVMERRFPVRVLEHALRRGSGGAGKCRGGDGVRRSFEFLEETQVSVLAQRRLVAPFGLDGGAPGATGQNELNGRALPGAVTLTVRPGDRLTISTPGGGGYGSSAH